MRPYVLAALLVVTGLVAVAPVEGRQEATRAPLTDAEMETFLLKGEVVRTRGTEKGVTNSVRATLSDGTLTHDAHIQTVDESKMQFRGDSGVTEFNFRDSWHFNIAVYKIDRLLGLNLVPVSVKRNWKSEQGAFTWWVDDVLMDEGQRLKTKAAPPNAVCWSQQSRMLRLLDQLIDNVDRNLGNVLITKNWRIWAIDHTRAFRYSRTPKTLKSLTGVDRGVLARLEALDFDTVKRAVDGHITDNDVRNLLSRRDAIVEHFKALGDKGLFDIGACQAGS